MRVARGAIDIYQEIYAADGLSVKVFMRMTAIVHGHVNFSNKLEI
jgi:hypothetical protein